MKFRHGKRRRRSPANLPPSSNPADFDHVVVTAKQSPNFCQELGGEEKRILRSLTGPEKELPYPRQPLLMSSGTTVEEYIIPDSDRQKVLELLFLFSPVPDLDEVMFDLHEEQPFLVRQYRVTREGNNNFLVSPYYPQSGGTVLDWVSQENAQDPNGIMVQIRKVKT